MPSRATLLAQIDAIRGQRDRAHGANVHAAERIIRLEADNLALRERLAARELELQELERRVPA